MGDGADLGIGPERALKTILGGDPEPGEDDRLSDVEMRKKIYGAVLQPESYEDCGWACARIVCEYLEHHPEDIGLPAEDVYDWERWRADANKNPELQNPGERLLDYRLATGLYDRIKDKDPERGEQLSGLGMTGFLWGWGYNAAHRVLGLPTAPNPAIITVHSDV